MPLCKRAEAAASGTRLTSTPNVGAFSNTPAGKDDEEVRLKTFPIDLARARDARAQRHALHIEDQFVADLRVKIARDFLVERDRHHVARLVVFHPPNPLPVHDFLRLRKRLAIRAAILALQLPLRNLPLRIGQDVGCFPPLHFRQSHRHDGRFLNHRQSKRAHRLRHARRLVRLNIEEKNVRLIARADGAELRQQALRARDKD